jgi:hypothetical protein
MTHRRGARASAALGVVLAVCTGLTPLSPLACRKYRTTQPEVEEPMPLDASTGDARDASRDTSTSDASLDVTVVDAAAAVQDKPDPTPERFVSDELTARSRHLFEALVVDNPTLARDVLYPRDAFIRHRDVKDPGRTWDRKVDAPFAKQLHAAHKQLLRKYRSLEHATFVRLELGSSMEQSAPREREWRVTTHHIFRSKLWFKVGDKVTHLDVHELVAYRGSWYVMRLR